MNSNLVNHSKFNKINILGYYTDLINHHDNEEIFQLSSKIHEEKCYERYLDRLLVILREVRR